jgi:hypothetical protein
MVIRDVICEHGRWMEVSLRSRPLADFSIRSAELPGYAITVLVRYIQCPRRKGRYSGRPYCRSF